MSVVPAARPSFSIITVCFNAISVLPQTAASLRAQHCQDYEWVVIDGASTDGTLEWVRAQSPDVLVSERDRGIYDAMNKGIAQGRGDWLFFLNAGDQFADANVLGDVLAEIAKEPAVDLLYGDVVYVGQQGARRKCFNWIARRNLVFGDLCHQAVFGHRRLFEKYGVFDDSLRFNADFDWLLRVFKGGAGLRYLPRDIAHFDDGGAHVQAHAASERERDAVRARYLPRPAWVMGNWWLRIQLKLRRLLGQSV